ncbi:MAG: deoxyribose-phosphate aldolase, partial [Gammaproteobacteria bacterium RIFCSPHIGHO2_12_FULL_41_20]
MFWAEQVLPYVAEASQADTISLLASRLISYIDLTSLNDGDTVPIITNLCKKAVTPFGQVAAVCIYPRFVKLAAQQLTDAAVSVATVVNFPQGIGVIDDVLVEIKQAIADGANEIDVVFPYQRFLLGEGVAVTEFIQQCRGACGSKVLLKVILETGALTSLDAIAEACRIAVMGGADFVKTSTGKIATGATLEAAATILLIIKELQPRMSRILGLKVSGG